MNSLFGTKIDQRWSSIVRKPVVVAQREQGKKHRSMTSSIMKIYLEEEKSLSRKNVHIKGWKKPLLWHKSFLLCLHTLSPSKNASDVRLFFGCPAVQSQLSWLPLILSPQSLHWILSVTLVVSSLMSFTFLGNQTREISGSSQSVEGTACLSLSLSRVS